MDDTDLGTLTREGDRWMLTFTRRVAHPRESVGARSTPAT